MEEQSPHNSAQGLALSLSKAIRRNPDRFLGNLERDGLLEELAFESLCHAIDEAIDGNCTQIRVAVDREMVVVEYDAGISLDIHPIAGGVFADVIFTELLACSNHKKHIEIGSKYCRYGLAVLNAACSQFQVDTIANGKQGIQTYFQGKAQESFDICSCDRKDRTVLRFKLDRELLGNCDLSIERLRIKASTLMQDLSPLRVYIFQKINSEASS